MSQAPTVFKSSKPHSALPLIMPRREAGGHGKRLARQRAQAARLHQQAFAALGLVDWHLPSSHPGSSNNWQSGQYGNLPAACPPLASIVAMAEHEPQLPPDEELHDQLDVITAPPQLKKPPMYCVLLFNDDYTPMEFVIEILQVYFSLDLDRATEVMLTVHYRGKGVAGMYPRDIAETKAQQVINYARSQGHPLLCQIEPQPE